MSNLTYRLIVTRKSSDIPVLDTGDVDIKAKYKWISVYQNPIIFTHDGSRYIFELLDIIPTTEKL